MEDRFGNRSLARWLLAKHKRRKMDQKVRDEIVEAAKQMATVTGDHLDCAPANAQSMSRYAAEDRFDFVHCSVADEIRAHGLGVVLNL